MHCQCRGRGPEVCGECVRCKANALRTYPEQADEGAKDIRFGNETNELLLTHHRQRAELALAHDRCRFLESRLGRGGQQLPAHDLCDRDIRPCPPARPTSAGGWRARAICSGVSTPSATVTSRNADASRIMLATSVTLARSFGNPRTKPLGLDQYSIRRERPYRCRRTPRLPRGTILQDRGRVHTSFLTRMHFSTPSQSRPQNTRHTWQGSSPSAAGLQVELEIQQEYESAAIASALARDRRSAVSV